MQSLSLRLRVHDSYYESRVPARLPLWANVRPTIPDYVSPGEAVWCFERPLVLSSRDTLQVIGQILDATAPQRNISVMFHGVGYTPRRPYFWEAAQAFAIAAQ